MEEFTDKRAEEIASVSSASENNSTSVSEGELHPMQVVNVEGGELCREEVAQSTTKYPFAWLDVVMIVLCFAISQGLGGLIAMIFGVELPSEYMRSSLDTETLEASATIQARFVAISYLISMAICLVLLGIYGRFRGWRGLLSLRSLGWASPFRLLCGYIFMWMVSISLEPLTALLPGDQSSLGSGGWLLLSAVLLAPIFEEVVFRGYIAGGLRRAYGGVVAWIVSALIFGAVHVIPSVAVSAFFSGLVLSFYYLRYRSLSLVILLHAANNATACFLLSFGMQELSLKDLMHGSNLYWGVYALCTLICVSLLLRMGRLLSRLKSDNSELKRE